MREIPNEIWNAAPKDVTWWMGAMPHPNVEYNDANECPGHGYVTGGDNVDLAYCDGSCVDEEEEAHARLMAGLLGVDLNDRYPKGDENGIIGRAPGGEPDEPLPTCTCPYWQDYHDENCPHLTELRARRQAWGKKRT